MSGLYVSPHVSICRQVGSPVYNLAVGLCLSSTDQREDAAVTMTECRDEPALTWDVLVDR